MERISGKEPRTVEQLKKMLEIIDLEIVREGENIDPRKLDRLTQQAEALTTEIANLTGEKIKD